MFKPTLLQACPNLLPVKKEKLSQEQIERKFLLEQRKNDLAREHLLKMSILLSKRVSSSGSSS